MARDQPQKKWSDTTMSTETRKTITVEVEADSFAASLHLPSALTHIAQYDESAALELLKVWGNASEPTTIILEKARIKRQELYTQYINDKMANFTFGATRTTLMDAVQRGDLLAFQIIEAMDGLSDDASPQDAIQALEAVKDKYTF